MNERIKQLEKQCWNHQSNHLNAEKFAQLIVKDCVSTLTDMHMWQSVNNQNYPSAWHDAVDQGIDTIKNHFGVE
jgi:hypothetical protein